jgi:DNA segregation ATPase FtsK/SpoIIIE-like protein
MRLSQPERLWQRRALRPGGGDRRQDRKCSTSYIQRKLSVGYNKAAKLVEMMEEQGVVSQANHVGKREVLVPER